jgi:hypothetical protein
MVPVSNGSCGGFEPKKKSVHFPDSVVVPNGSEEVFEIAIAVSKPFMFVTNEYNSLVSEVVPPPRLAARVFWQVFRAVVHELRLLVQVPSLVLQEFKLLVSVFSLLVQTLRSLVQVLNLLWHDPPAA